MPNESENERLQNEIALLEAMYPGQLVYFDKARELKYTSEAATFTLRLPPGYPDEQLPEVLAASVGRSDCREQLRQQVKSLEAGDEVLDSIIAAFNELELEFAQDAATYEEPTTALANGDSKATVIVWLHHLLNTNKRKQALAPLSLGVSGLTKPGYPGVLIYSGVASAVHEHVKELRALNWQAFQVRFESDEEWTFTHGRGVKEVESMKEIVAEIEETRKAAFMEALRMK